MTEQTKLGDLIISLYDVRQRKSALEKVEKNLVAELKPIIDPRFDVSPDTPIVDGGLSLYRVSGVSRTVQVDLLLERGVSPEIINFATKTSTYYQYRIKEQK